MSTARIRLLIRSASWARIHGSHLTSRWLRPRATTRIWSILGAYATNPSASPTATLHARWFLEYDPYAALEAIEVSRRWGQVINPNVAAAAAAVACFHQTGVVSAASQRAAVAALSGLASDGNDDELEAYGEGLMDAVAGYRAQAEDDIRPLAEALWTLSRAGQSELAEAAALTLLEWAAKIPVAANAWADAHAAQDGSDLSLPWTNDDARDHAAGLLGTCLNQVSDSALPAAFSLARALNTGVRATRCARACNASPCCG